MCPISGGHIFKNPGIIYVYINIYSNMQSAYSRANRSRPCDLNRGYYMTAGRYRIRLRVLNNISQVSAANE